jgi:tetratricopeptide (TPR) repeat protein
MKRLLGVLQLGLLLLVHADEQVSVEKALELALQWREEGRRDEALDLIQRITQAQPQYAAARMVLGAMSHETGDFATAISQYDQAIVLDPRLDGAYFNKGRALYSQQQYPQAIAEFTNVLNINSKFVSAWHSMALALHFTGRLDEAEWAYSSALEVNEETHRLPEIHYDFAVTLQHAGKVVHSSEQYNLALTHSPNMTESWLNLAALHHKWGDVGDAIRNYKRAMDTPGLTYRLRVMTMNNLGVALSQSGQVAAAVSTHQQVLQLLESARIVLSYCTSYCTLILYSHTVLSNCTIQVLQLLESARIVLSYCTSYCTLILYSHTVPYRCCSY